MNDESKGTAAGAFYEYKGFVATPTTGGPQNYLLVEVSGVSPEGESLRTTVTLEVGKGLERVHKDVDEFLAFCAKKAERASKTARLLESSHRVRGSKPVKPKWTAPHGRITLTADPKIAEVEVTHFKRVMESYRNTSWESSARAYGRRIDMPVKSPVALRDWSDLFLWTEEQVAEYDRLVALKADLYQQVHDALVAGNAHDATAHLMDDHCTVFLVPVGAKRGEEKKVERRFEVSYAVQDGLLVAVLDGEPVPVGSVAKEVARDIAVRDHLGEDFVVRSEKIPGYWHIALREQDYDLMVSLSDQNAEVSEALRRLQREAHSAWRTAAAKFINEMDVYQEALEVWESKRV